VTWLSNLVEEHSEFESPKSFWWWSALCSISAVVKDNVWMDSYIFKVYPNIFVMLHADSGLKKGPPINLARDLVRKVNNTKIISGRSSIQGILWKLGHAQTRPGEKPNLKSNGFIVASEFSSSIVRDQSALDILTDLYDRNYNSEEWESLLKQEQFNLKDPTVSMLVAINKAHFNDFIDAKDVHGGFLGRMFVVLETEVNRLNPLIKKPKYIPDRDKLAVYLKDVAKLRGPFESLENTEAGEMYDAWYMKFYETVIKQKISDPTGTINRVGDSVKKVAMLISMGDNLDLVVKSHHMEEAIEICQGLLTSVKKTTLGKIGKENASTNRKTILINLLMDESSHSIARTRLLRDNWMHGDAIEWNESISSLEEAEMIQTEHPGGKQIVISMSDKQYEQMRTFLEAKR